ncbi:glycosyltransferase [Paraburkholderia sprentiae]|uniref:glycosyltransferase n=1 Tax=Paraburkholderia sprentiae TaxID=948107 RepID=UPI001E4D16DD|nr:glycosyltransferase [Paraburkholderia sprentiae]
MTIASLLGQSFKNMEVIVVNGPSSDSTQNVIDKYKNNIKSLNCAELNLSKSRNIGIAAAAGDVVAFVDDDAIVEPFWAERILSAYVSEDVGAVGGFVFDHTGFEFQTTYIVCDRLGASWVRVEFDPAELYSLPGAFKYSAMIGTNCSFRRDILLSICGFDEEYEYFLDETDVCVRVIDKGYKICQAKGAYVHHKFLPSYMRSASRVTLHHYPILKNTLYFGLKHASSQMSQQAIRANVDEIYARHLKDAEAAALDGRMAPEIAEQLPATYQRACRDAIERSASAAFHKPLRSCESGLFFLPAVSRDLDRSRQLCVALLCRNYDADDSGIARFVRVQARALEALGHIVHVLTESKMHPTVDWEDGVWVHRLVLGWFDDQQEMLPLQVHPDQWCYSRTALEEIRKINGRHRVDVVEAPLWGNEALAIIASKEFPVVVSLQTSQAIALESHPEWQRDSSFMRDVVRPTIEGENYVLANCDLIRTISRAIANEISSRNGIKLADGRVVLCPLALEDRATSRISSLDLARPMILFVGRLELRKGIDTLLDALPKILREFSNAQVVIVGDDKLPTGDGKQTFRQIFEAKHVQLLDNVHFTGVISDTEVDEYFQRAALFVAPSRFESFGLIYVEAMMFDVPTVACDVGGVPEVFADSGCAKLVEPDNPVALADAVICELRKLFDAEQGRTGRARQEYERRFLPEQMALQMSEIYRSVLPRKVR